MWGVHTSQRSARMLCARTSVEIGHLRTSIACSRLAEKLSPTGVHAAGRALGFVLRQLLGDWNTFVLSCCRAPRRLLCSCAVSISSGDGPIKIYTLTVVPELCSLLCYVLCVAVLCCVLLCELNV